MIPTVTVIIPTHDRPAKLAEAVESVLQQSLKPAEFIIVHDGQGEVDTSLKSQVEAAGISYKYIHRDEPSLTKSRNAGLAAASSDIAVFGEDDAVFAPDFIEELTRFYAADTEREITAIGANIIEPHLQTRSGKAWGLLAKICCQIRWAPRRCLARYVKLPREIAGKLSPVRRTSGAGLSVRLADLGETRFDENLSGHSFGEDRDFSFRLTQTRAIFYAYSLVMHHHPGEGGRGDMLSRGRIYVGNWLYICGRATEGGAGTKMLLCWDFFGTIILYLTAALLGGQRENFRFVRGMVAELAGRAIGWARRLICG